MDNRYYEVKIKGISPYSGGAYLPSSKKADLAGTKLTPTQLTNVDRNEWRHRLNTDDGGNVVIRHQALKSALINAAKYTGKKIPNEGKKTFTAKIRSGLHVYGGGELGVHIDSDVVRMEVLHVPTNGEAGSGKRTLKRFPIIDEWSTVFKFVVTDECLSDIFLEEFLEVAGNFIGLGRWRPENGGTNGMFEATLKRVKAK